MHIRKIIVISALSILAASCGNQQEVKNTSVGVTASSSSSTAAVVAYDRMKDVSYSNAVAFLQESLQKENASPNAANRLNSGKAFLLLLQVLKERYLQFGEAGFEKIGFSSREFDNYKSVSRMKLADVSADSKATPDDKAEAKRRLDQLEGLMLK